MPDPTKMSQAEIELINKFIVRPYLLGQALNGIMANLPASATNKYAALKAVEVVDHLMKLEEK